MKTLIKPFLGIMLLASIVSIPVTAQSNYKHPYLNASGHGLDSTGNKLGWITKEGVIYNANGEKVGTIEKQILTDYKGHKLGTIGKDGSFRDADDKLVFTIESTSKGEKCKLFDPYGKVIATVHESYKNQACAIHCLYKKMPSH